MNESLDTESYSDWFLHLQKLVLRGFIENFHQLEFRSYFKVIEC